MSVIMELTQSEVRVCASLALERWLTKTGSTDRPNYARGKSEGRLEHDLNAGIRANVCEWAVAKHWGFAWNVPWYPNSEHPKRSDLADVGINGEVRSVRTFNSIPYWPKDEGRVIIGCKVLDDNYFSVVEIYGVFEPLFEPEYADGKGGYRMPIERLKL